MPRTGAASKTGEGVITESLPHAGATSAASSTARGVGTNRRFLIDMTTRPTTGPRVSIDAEFNVPPVGKAHKHVLGCRLIRLLANVQHGDLVGTSVRRGGTYKKASHLVGEAAGHGSVVVTKNHRCSGHRSCRVGRPLEHEARLPKTYERQRCWHTLRRNSSGRGSVPARIRAWPRLVSTRTVGFVIVSPPAGPRWSAPFTIRVARNARE